MRRAARCGVSRDSAGPFPALRETGMRANKSMTTAFVAAAFCVLAAVPASGDAPVDVVFVTDDSPSMARNDPYGLRSMLFKALCDLLAHQGGDRVAVLRLGGALESAEAGIEVFPLTEIPKAADEKAKALFELKAVFDGSLAGFGRAADFNHLFEKGVFPLLRDRKDARKAILILVTDGKMDVVEGNRVHEDYRKAVADSGQAPGREALNDAALRRFRNAALPMLAETGLTVVPIAVAGSPAADSAVLADLASLKGGTGRVIPLSPDINACVADVLRALGREIGLIPLGPPVTLKAEPGSEISRDMWIPSEASATRILVVSDTADFTISFSDVSGSALGSEEGLGFFGANEKHRVISLGRQKIPNRILKLRNRGKQAASFGIHTLSRFDIAPRAKVVNPGRTAVAGGSIMIEAGLVSLPDETPVRDRWLVERSSVDISVIDSSGERTEITRGFSGGDSAFRIVEIPLSKDAAGGTYLLRIEPRILSGADAVSTGWVDEQVKVVAARTVVKVEFDSTAGFPDTEVSLKGAVESGKVESEALEIRLAARGGTGDAISTSLKWDPEARIFRGSVKFPFTGRFEVERSMIREVEVQPGLAGGVDISERRFSVLGASGKPIEGLTFEGAAGSAFGDQSVEISANLAPGEEGSFTISPELRADAGAVAVEILKDGQLLLGQERIRLAGGKAGQKLTLRLKPGNDARPSGEIGTFRIRGKIGESSMVLDKYLRVVPLPPGAVEKKVLYEDLRVVAAAAAAGGLLVLGLAWWLVQPRFKSEHIVELDPSTGEPGEGTMLRDMSGSVSPGRADGMPDVKNSVSFELTGLRPFSKSVCLAGPLKPFIQFHVNGKPYLSPTQIRHGDWIRLRGSRFTREYVFFTAPVEDDDWKEIMGRIAADKSRPRQEVDAQAEAPAAATAAPSASTGEAAAQLDRIFGGEAKPAAEAPAPTPAAPESQRPRKVVTLEDFFGADAAEKVRVEEGHKPKAAAEPARDETPKGAEGEIKEALDDQATVLETFFGSKDGIPGKPAAKAAEKAPAPAEEPGEEETILNASDAVEKLFGGEKTEIVDAGAEEPAEHAPEFAEKGDSTEIVESVEEPPGFKGDRTEVVEGDVQAKDEMEFFEVSEDEEPSIEIPERVSEPEPAPEPPADESAEIPAELRETKVEESTGILGKAYGTEMRTIGKQAPKEDVEISNEGDDDVEIIESGEEFEAFPEQQTILETAFGDAMKEDRKVPPQPPAGEQGQIIVIDEWESKKIEDRNKGKDKGTRKR